MQEIDTTRISQTSFFYWRLKSTHHSQLTLRLTCGRTGASTRVLRAETRPPRPRSPRSSPGPALPPFSVNSFKRRLAELSQRHSQQYRKEIVRKALRSSEVHEREPALRLLVDLQIQNQRLYLVRDRKETSVSAHAMLLGLVHDLRRPQCFNDLVVLQRSSWIVSVCFVPRTNRSATRRHKNVDC